MAYVTSESCEVRTSASQDSLQWLPLALTTNIGFSWMRLARVIDLYMLFMVKFSSFYSNFMAKKNDQGIFLNLRMIFACDTESLASVKSSSSEAFWFYLRDLKGEEGMLM